MSQEKIINNPIFAELETQEQQPQDDGSPHRRGIDILPPNSSKLQLLIPELPVRILPQITHDKGDWLD